MKLITTIPIYRNRFQKPAWFFSIQHFKIGSLIFIPYPSNSKNKKPALIIKTDDLEKQKFFLRKNKIKVQKLDQSSPQIPLLKKTHLDLIIQISEKTKLSILEILQKIFTKKIIKELNQLSVQKKVLPPTTQNYLKKIDITFVKKKVLKKKRIQELSKKQEIHSMKELLPSQLAQKKTLYSEKHYLVDEIRNYFGETATKGKGSFSFYLGFFEKIPKTTIYQYWAEVKSSRKSIKDQQKLFWWKIGQFLKKIKKG